MHQRCKGGRELPMNREGEGGNHYFRVTTLFGGDRFCTPNYGVSPPLHQLSNSCDKKGFDRPTRTCTTWGAISPPIALITHIAHRPTIHPAAFRRPFSVIRGFSPHPDRPTF